MWQRLVNSGLGLITIIRLADMPIPSAYAQAPTGVVRGVAKLSEDSASIPFALVRLMPADTSFRPHEAITNAQGRFQFVAVPVGRGRRCGKGCSDFHELLPCHSRL